jgi:ribosomal subunit interface protein
VDIIFHGRRTSIQERFREYATAKLSKIVKLDQKTISIDVEVTLERNPRQSAQRERVELTLYSRGPVMRAEAAADDRFMALDRALAKLETHVRRACDRRKARNTGHSLTVEMGTVPDLPVEAMVARPAGATSLTPADGTAMAADGDGSAQAGESDWPESDLQLDGIVPIPMEGNGPLVVREKFHSATPMTIDRALHEMELVGHDFFLFRDETCHLPSVVYRRQGYNYGVIRLVEGAATELAGTPARRVPVD